MILCQLLRHLPVALPAMPEIRVDFQTLRIFRSSPEPLAECDSVPVSSANARYVELVADDPRHHVVDLSVTGYGGLSAAVGASPYARGSRIRPSRSFSVNPASNSRSPSSRLPSNMRASRSMKRASARVRP